MEDEAMASNERKKGSNVPTKDDNVKKEQEMTVLFQGSFVPR
jgi:hypothetical protein